MMKKFTAIMMALMMVLTLTQCKPDKGNEGDTQNGSKVKVSCVIPMNKNTRSEFDNLMTDGKIKWSAGIERIYLVFFILSVKVDWHVVRSGHVSHNRRI